MSQHRNGIIGHARNNRNAEIKLGAIAGVINIIGVMAASGKAPLCEQMKKTIIAPS